MPQTDSSDRRSRSLREELIPLPGIEDGYSRIMLVGTTGAGKTTLLCHLIGTDPNRERFPSTSTAKTTTAEYEIVCAPGQFEAAVTFMDRNLTQANVNECINEACERALSGDSDDAVAAALLEHPEQRFRLKYVLGDWNEQTAAEREQQQASFDDEWDLPDEDETDEQGTLPEGDRLSDSRILRNNEILRSLVIAVQEICESIDQDLLDSRRKRFRENDDPTEKNAIWEEIVVPILELDDNVARLSELIMAEIVRRMDEVEVGEFRADSGGGWKHSWYFAHPDRAEFLRQLRRMTGNHFQQFGNLLTPLVDGVRIRGPFVPAAPIANGDSFKLALIDGEGLGHTARGADSVSTRITERFQDVDLIVLVDNAQQPMQAAPLSLLRTAAQSGHGDKLAVAFTHFDQVQGDNLNSAGAKRAHVASSVTNALTGLRDQLSPRAFEMLQSQVTAQTYFLSDLNRPPSRINKRFIGELRKLVIAMDESGVLAGDIDLAPIYSMQQFELGLRDAADAFKTPWRRRLGIIQPSVKEHWARVKAFTRRMWWGRDEYQHLRPVADLINEIQKVISMELERPQGWTRRGQEADERQVIDRIEQRVFQSIHEIARARIVHNPESR